MRDDHDRKILLQLQGEILDLRGGDRVECGGRLIHEQDIRLDGQCTGDAETLLLSTGQTECGFSETILQLIPDRRLTKRGLDDLIELLLVADTVRTWTVGNIVIDRHRERIRLLEDHADPLTKCIDIDILLIDVLSIEEDLTIDATALHQVVHTVQRLEQRGLATAGRSDEGRDLIRRDVQIDVMKRVECAIVQIHIFDFKLIHNLRYSFSLRLRCEFLRQHR